MQELFELIALEILPPVATCARHKSYTLRQDLVELRIKSRMRVTCKNDESCFFTF